MAEIIIDNENGEVRVTGEDKELIIRAENVFIARRICGGIRCSENNTACLRLQAIGAEIVCGDLITWNTELDMDTYTVRVVGYDPR